jgi:DNA-binding transcriptional MerR regulator
MQRADLLSRDLFSAMPLKPSPKKKAVNGVSADDIVIPDKLYFRIGEVARLCYLPAYVLRFWETEFPQLSPKKSSKGQRLYRQRDVEHLVRIKKLLYEEGFTIAGARQQLKLEAKPIKAQAALFSSPRGRSTELKHVRAGLQDILGLLKQRR